MLTNTDFIAVGQSFPPVSEIPRIARYHDNQLLFDGEFMSLYRDSWQEMLNAMDSYRDDLPGMIERFININYFRLTSTAVADLVCSESPTISAMVGEKIIDLEPMLRKADFYKKLYNWVIDISRYGDSAQRVYKHAEKGVQVATYDPSSVFAVVNPEDKDDITCYVYAGVVEIPKSKGEPTYHLIVQKHYKGYYLASRYLLTPNASEVLFNRHTGQFLPKQRTFTIKAVLEDEQRITTGIDDIALSLLSQLKTSDTTYGHDDYTLFEDTVSSIIERLMQVNEILRRNAFPDMYGPDSAFKQNSDGSYTLKSGHGDAWMLAEGDTPPGYVTYDGSLTACFEYIRLMFEQLYKLSEMGAVYQANAGASNISYDTMRTSFIRPLAKAKRITNEITSTLKQIIAEMTELSPDVDTVKADNITITWYDGLPNDERQEIDKSTAKINAGLTTPKRENVERFGMSPEQAEQVDDEVREYQADKSASMFGGFGSMNAEGEPLGEGGNEGGGDGNGT